MVSITTAHNRRRKQHNNINRDVNVHRVRVVGWELVRYCVVEGNRREEENCGVRMISGASYRKPEGVTSAAYGLAMRGNEDSARALQRASPAFHARVVNPTDDTMIMASHHTDSHLVLNDESAV